MKEVLAPWKVSCMIAPLPVPVVMLRYTKRECGDVTIGVAKATLAMFKDRRRRVMINVMVIRIAQDN